MQFLDVLKDMQEHIRKASCLENFKKARRSISGTVAYEKQAFFLPILHRPLRGSIARRSS
jgi:hypothetical protein